MGVLRGQQRSRPTNSANQREYDKYDLSLTLGLSSPLENPFADRSSRETLAVIRKNCP